MWLHWPSVFSSRKGDGVTLVKPQSQWPEAIAFAISHDWWKWEPRGSKWGGYILIGRTNVWSHSQRRNNISEMKKKGGMNKNIISVFTYKKSDESLFSLFLDQKMLVPWLWSLSWYNLKTIDRWMDRFLHSINQHYIHRSIQTHSTITAIVSMTFFFIFFMNPVIMSTVVWLVWNRTS